MAELADAQDLGSCALTVWGFDSPPSHKYANIKSGCSSVVEHHVANVNVVGSSPITRSNFLTSVRIRNNES